MRWRAIVHHPAVVILPADLTPSVGKNPTAFSRQFAIVKGSNTLRRR
jgi:hypothetical protein